VDELSVSISPAEPSGFDDGVYFLVTAFVNGEALFDWLDVDEFFKSLHPGGGGDPDGEGASTATRPLPIFNCSCGCFGCGGYYVDVTHTPEALVWENTYFTDGADREPFARWCYALPWRNVRDVAGELIAAIYSAQAQSPSGEVRYGSTGVEVTERLPYYLERYETLPDTGGTRDSGEVGQ